MKQQFLGILDCPSTPYRDDPRFTALLRRMNLAE